MNTGFHLYRLTAPLSAAIATVVAQGEGAVEAVKALAQLRTDRLDINKVHFATWPISPHAGGAPVIPTVEPEDAGTSPREHVVIVRTGDDEVEIHCHGGPAVVDSILAALHRAGGRISPPQEYQSRSSYHRSRIRSEAEEDLVHAATDRIAALLLDQAHGALEHALGRILDILHQHQTTVAMEELDLLLQRVDLGQHLLKPWRIVLAGPPNVGKSSLLNAITGDRRAIVHATPGTTRDVVESSIAVDGWLLQVSDTAGLREDTSDTIEQAGMWRAEQVVAGADLTILVVDASEGWTPTHERLWTIASHRRLVAWNKCDLTTSPPPTQWQGATVVPTIAVPESGQPQGTAAQQSGARDNGTQALLHHVVDSLIPALPPGAAIPFRDEHALLLRQARQALVAQDVASAVECLQRLVVRE